MAELLNFSAPARLSAPQGWLAGLSSAAAIALTIACSGPGAAPQAAAGFVPAPTRGIVLISIDTLRADHLGCYGYRRDTSPFLDSLARRATLFERLYAQVPATLPSHLSIFTGLYPGEHGVVPPSGVLSPEIETLPEALSRAGFRTSGHSEGGYVAGGYGFARGFEEWSERPYAADRDVEATFRRGSEFLARLGREERFFLFLHTYSVHDPYDPPEPFRSRYWQGAAPSGAFPPTGENFDEFNKGRLAAGEEEGRYYQALYDGSIRFVDSVLESFFGELSRLGLADETTVLVTSDHGEEFLEHGRLVHTQVYPESLHVPLLLVHPQQSRGLRVPELVQTIDLFPTILELAGVQPQDKISGRSLLPAMARPQRRDGAEAFAEDQMLGGRQRALLQDRADGLWNFISFAPDPDPDGTWVSRRILFDTSAPRLDFRAVAFHQPRSVRLAVDGEERDVLTVGTDWQSVAVKLGNGERRRRVALSTSECESPLALGTSGDPRCLSFKLQGLGLERSELYALERDPSAQRDLSGERLELHRELYHRQASYRFQPVAAAGRAYISAEQEKALRALGYLR